MGRFLVRFFEATKIRILVVMVRLQHKRINQKKIGLKLDSAIVKEYGDKFH